MDGALVPAVLLQARTLIKSVVKGPGAAAQQAQPMLGFPVPEQAGLRPEGTTTQAPDNGLVPANARPAPSAAPRTMPPGCCSKPAHPRRGGTPPSLSRR
eukprot:1622112-Pyramimonas_sp.AAC.1